MAWPFTWKLPADSEDFGGDTDDRRQAAKAAAGALCNESDVISDWGDFDKDHSDDTHDKSEGVTARPKGFAKSLDVDTFYDQCRAEEIKIRDPDSDK
jgi:hypothetical protein